jgi:hypothetical protein
MARPACELHFRCENEKRIVYTNGALDEKECDLIFRAPTEYYKSFFHYAAVTFYNGSIDRRVKAALKLGFFFDDEIEERKWKSGKSFSMYRKRIKVNKRDERLAKEKQEKLENEVAERIKAYAQVLKMPVNL